MANGNGIKAFVKRFWVILTGIGVVIGILAGIYGLDSVIATEKDLDIYKKDVNAEIVHLKEDVLASFEQFQKQQQQILRNQELQFWTQKYQEYSDKEADFKYQLKKDPRNQDLKDQYEFWKQKRIEAQKKIQELTKPPTGG